jgi:hypothetical protein
MVVWLAVIPVFWATLGWVLRDGVVGRGRLARSVGRVISSWLGVVVFVDYLIIALTAQIRLDVVQSLIR